MHERNPALAVAIIIALLAGPAILAVWGIYASYRRPKPATSSTVQRPWWAIVVNSAMLYALAYNLVFFLQELFLVLPKALTPGLKPTLYHNNHDWTGNNPIARLFQGTGAVAILIVGTSAVGLLQARKVRSPMVVLALIWIAFQGLMQSLLQVPSGTLDPHNDLGEAMNYLAISVPVKTIASLLALALIPIAALWTANQLLEFEWTAGRSQPSREIFYLGTLPMLLGTLLVVPFRVPGSLDRILISPLIVGVIGILWAQAGGWAVGEAAAARNGQLPAQLSRLVAGTLIAMLLVFQLILRPGIHFY